MERDVHKLRVVQGESVYQAAGVAPFRHNLRKAGDGGRGRVGQSGLVALEPTLPPLKDPTHVLVEQRWQLLQGAKGAVP